jgi:acyl-[acyl carrier protein]--UDP-N-acetylglucosamine O-acyltransferase
VTVWSGAHVGHDSRIDDHCFLAPNVAISGNVHVQPYCFIGINATLRNSVTIAQGTLVGGGAVILKDTVADGVYMARPAQLLEKSSDEIEP